MSKKRISGSQSKYRRPWDFHTEGKLEILRFTGVSLSGGKNDRTCLVTIDYYPRYKKIFLKEIHDKILSPHDDVSQDKLLIEILNKKDPSLKSIAMDSPLTLPPCLEHRCGGVEKCKSAATKWMWHQYKRIKKKKKNLKIFTPYTERCIERYINYDLEEFFEIPEALGANKAPLTARSFYLKNKIKKKIIEVFPKLSVFRMGSQMKLSARDLKNYRHSVYGVSCRTQFIQTMVEKDFLFIYEQDRHKLIENPHSFDAMICALTAYLNHFKQCEKPPKGFPAETGWICFPMAHFRFSP